MYFNEINEKRLTIFEQKEKKNYFINNKREKSFKKGDTHTHTQISGQALSSFTMMIVTFGCHF